MKRVFFFLFCAAAIAAWCPASFAARQIVNADAPISADGILSGVDMAGLVTLTVGTIGGAKTDIFTSNTALASFPLAVSTTASSQGSIVFNSDSDVFGNKIR